MLVQVLPGGFAGGDELLEIRKDVESLEKKMRDAVGNGDLEMAVRFREAIVKTEARDPEARYNQLKAQYDEAAQAQVTHQPLLSCLSVPHTMLRLLDLRTRRPWKRHRTACVS